MKRTLINFLIYTKDKRDNKQKHFMFRSDQSTNLKDGYGFTVWKEMGLALHKMYKKHVSNFVNFQLRMGPKWRVRDPGRRPLPKSENFWRGRQGRLG